MSDRTDAPPDQTTPTRLDWSRATISDPAPCAACGRPALLRHPETGRPHHKVCDELQEDVRVFHREGGWVFSFEPGIQPCTINRVPESEGKQDCAATAVWKIVRHSGLVLTLSVWCDEHLPAEHRGAASGGAILPCRFCREPASLRGPEGQPEHWTCRRKAASHG